MIDWQNWAVMGFFVGLGTETAKIVHELYIKPKILKANEKIKGMKKDGFELEL